MSPPRSSGLYLLTPDSLDTAHLLSQTRSALQAGITWLQYRNKVADAHLRHEQAMALRRLCDEYGVPLIINDDLPLADAVRAAGVHLGEHDDSIATARATLGPNALVGASCYDDIERAKHAVAKGASYIAFGAFFASPTKPVARRAKLQLLDEARSLGVPTVAIGGITPDNGGLLTAAGADLLAVISSVYQAPDIGAAVRAYHSCFPDKT
ncbi:thiamine phosphate synthase [Xanthomonadaceae bacterium JHOS43]|nr:thiamine phosphate synthase [Xanthomonadaceae bacterium JHOS43]